MADQTGQPGVPPAARGAAGGGKQGAGEQEAGEQGGDGQEHDGRRAKLIAAAQARWISTLTDLGGRNTLLYYKDRRAGTLDLAGADPDSLERFCRTGSIRLTRLFGDADLRADAIRRVQAIYRKARELQEERGIRAAYLATGMARWDELFLEPAAPVLLRGLTITPTRARHDDFDLGLDEEAEVNPVLLHKLATAFGAATEELAAERGDRLIQALCRAAALAEVPGFEIRPRQVIGTFTYAKLPMVRDLEAAADLLGDSDVVAAIAGEWQDLRTGAGLPVLPSAYAELAGLAAEVDGQLTALRGYIRLPADPEPLLAELAADRDTAWKLPRLYELGTGFDDSGLGALLDELARRQATPELAAAAFDQAWYTAILDRVRVADPRYAAHRGGALDEIASDFRVRDVQHLSANRARVRRAWAQQLREATDRHPLQARVIRKQAALRRGHLPLRRLVDQAHDVLFALRPCWAASPLIVSQVLPAARLFDVVIFDEASQIIPADAIPSIMRGHQIVVAGDDRQLPPTNFFRQIGDEGEDGAEDEDSLVSFGAGFESVLEALRPLLPTWPLAWHYRSRDERLVAFSNTHIYGGALTTFPGVLRDDCLRHVVVAQGPEPGQEVSVTAEVEQVVGLILEHARVRPHESLGVIALGIKHADRIDTALRGALAAHPGLEGFFAEDQPEPFFVKNLERVQGDERDAIILSIGYGKHPDGRMRYQWGPLLRDGGERRLNVAATRAKHRLTLVSSFSSHDIDPDRVTKAGARLLADYLEYASSGGTAVSASGSDQLNPFEADVRDRLAEFGITVVPQYGVGGYRIDFAAAHPQDPDRMVLAIEADGASYRQSGSVRDRDRLRGEHLQRLGWSFHRLWSTNWFYDAKAEVTKLRDAYDRAVAAADEAAPPPPPVPEPSRPEEPAAAPGQELDISDRPGPVTRSSP